MSNTSQGTQVESQLVPVAPVAIKLVTNLDTVVVFAALGYWLRWQILMMLANGRRLSTPYIASAFRRPIDGVSKQLRVLRDAGVLACCVGEDRRETVYYLPKAFRAEPGVLDYGVCRIPFTPQ